MLLGKAIVRKIVEYILRQELCFVIRCYGFAVVITIDGGACEVYHNAYEQNS